MGIGYEIGSAIAGAAGELFKTGYNIWSNQRDFDYQKALQNEVFAREDNAVQRRVKDLEAAGLNPNLAAGSAAGSGAVVGRSSTNQLAGNPVGTALDMAQHVQQLRAQRTENQILNNQKIQSEYAASLARYDYANEKLATLFDRAAIYNQLGVDKLELRFNKDGEISLWSPSFNLNKNGMYKIALDDSPLMKQLRWQVQNNQNAATLLQKDVDWYNANQIINGVRAGASAFGSFGSGYYNFNRRR